MPRRCTNCANVQRRQQRENNENRDDLSCQETGTDPNTVDRGLCLVTQFGGYCGRTICSMMRGVTWTAGTLLCCLNMWMVYSELSGCVTGFLWNMMYSFLAITICGAILVVISGPDSHGGNNQREIKREIRNTNGSLSESVNTSKQRYNNYEQQSTSETKSVAGNFREIEGVGTSNLSSRAGGSKISKDGRSAGAGEAGKTGTLSSSRHTANDAEIKVTEFSSNDNLTECDPCPAVEEN